MDFLKMRNSSNFKYPKDKIFFNSNLIMDKTFDRDLGYQNTAIYDRFGNFIKEIDFKFQRTREYSINKDQVEYAVQFRPDFHPELDLNIDSEKGFLGFYVDVYDDANELCKYLIVGRDDRLSFVRYNVLKCNWTFKWIKGSTLYSQMGVLRSRNNYNSGVWREYFTTTVQNQIQFIVPSNENTYTIDYDDRFMLTTNKIHPKTYTATKVEDTFPSGIVKVTLAQDHFNPKTDNVDLLVCNYYSSTNSNVVPKSESSAKDLGEIICSSSSKILRVGKSTKILSLTLNPRIRKSEEDFLFSYKLDGVEKSLLDLADLFSIAENPQNGQVSVKALSKKLIGGTLEVSISCAGFESLDEFSENTIQVNVKDSIILEVN